MKKKLLAVVLTVCMVATMMLVPAMAADEGTFTDVSGDHWASEAIERWAGYGILNGIGDGTFNPEGDMTRAQFAKVVVELLGLSTDSTEMPFEDVIGSDDDWAKGHIAAAHAAGIVNGTSDTRFSPRKSVSFDDSAAILSRALGLVEPKAYGEDVTAVLDELDMLGALEDFVSGDADMNRAAVAALADNMIGYYVTPETVDEVTEDGVISGDVKGIILVVGGADGVEVEVKDATVPAVVAVGGAVKMTGETTVDTVKVAGTSAVVNAEKDTTIGTVAVEGDKATVALDGTVENVTVGGKDAALTVDGTVANVTVTADATVSKLEGTGVSSENVVNESPVEITVNDETIEAAPVEETPGEDEETPDEEQGESTGFVPTPVTPPADVTTGTIGGGAATDNRATVPAASGGTVDTTGIDAEDICEEHEWGTANVTKAATCTTAGEAVYTCSVCGATSTVAIAATTHDFTNSTRMGFDADNHWKICKYCDTADTTKTAHDLTYTSYGSGGHTATCADCGYTVSEAHDNTTKNGYYTDASFHWAVCDDCDAHYAQAVHTWGAWGAGVKADLPAADQESFDEATQAVQKRSCSVCGYVQVKVVAKTAAGGDGEGEGGDDGDKTVTHTNEHTLDYDSSKSAQITDAVHPTKCTTENCNFTGGTAAHSYTSGTCTVCSHVCAHTGQTPEAKCTYCGETVPAASSQENLQ